MATHQPYLYEDQPQYAAPAAAPYQQVPAQHYAAVPAQGAPYAVPAPQPDYAAFPQQSFAPPAQAPQQQPQQYGSGSFAPPPAPLQTPGMHTGPSGGPRSHDGASSVSSRSTGQWEQLPLCPEDSGCMQVNVREHQRTFSHTCRLFPCYHAHLPHHHRCFRHQPGQGAEPPASDADASAPLGPDSGARRSANASETTGSRASGSRKGRARPKQRKTRPVPGGFAHIGPECPGAACVTITRGDDSFEAHGDWAKVPLHTLKRYLHQALSVPAAAIVLRIGGVKLEGELKMAQDLGVVAGAEVVVVVDESRVADVAGAPAASAAPSKIPASWL